jgi:hypothetical protein
MSASLADTELMQREELGRLLNLRLEAERAGARLLAAYMDALPPGTRKGLELRTWRERLDFLNRGQRWVARRIAEALPRIPSSAGKRALQEMHESHLANISLCEQLLTD